MPKQRKPVSASAAVAAKELSQDFLGFQNLFTQSKGIITRYLIETEDQFSWLESFYEEAKACIESVGKNSDSDLSQLNGTADISGKDGNQPISSKESEEPQKTRRKKSSRLHKSSLLNKVAPINTTQDSSDGVDLNNDKENIDQNSPLQSECDASSTCNSVSVDKLNSKTKLYHKMSDNVKIDNYVIIVSEPVATVTDSPVIYKSPVTQNVCNRTSAIKVDDKILEDCGVSSDAKLKTSSVILQRLTDVKLRESGHCTVPSNAHDRTSVKRLSNEDQEKGNRTFCGTKRNDSIVDILEQIETEPRAKELGECAKVSSSRISSKRKLSQEIRRSSHLVLESASRMSETQRRSSLMRVKIRSSKEFLMVTENSQPVNKKLKVSNSEKLFLSDASDDKVSKPNSSDSDRGIGSSGSSAGSGSQRSNTSICSLYAKESLIAPKTSQLQSVKNNGQLNRKRSYESMGYKTPETNTLKRDFNNSNLRLQNYKSMLSSQSKTTPKSAYVFSSSKTAKHASKSKLFNGSHYTKPCTPLHGGNTTFLKSQAAAHESEKEKYRQEEAKRQQEKEQACLKKQQMLKMQVEEKKRKREERMRKNLEARQQLEREKAERHKFIEQKEMKLSYIAKEKEKLKEIKKNRLKNDSLDDGGTMKKHYNLKAADKMNTPMDSTKTRSREVVSSKPVISVTKHVISAVEAAISSEDKTLKLSEPQPATLNSTFVKNEENQSESYEITPCRPRSTYCNYDISELKSDDESEDELAPTKPVPAWAVGMTFKQALINQHYHPPDLDDLFSGSINIPDLSEMFTQKKARYLRRTSSAIWNTPDRVVFAIKSYS